MLSHRIMFANPFADFPCASTYIFEIALSSNTDEWGTLVTAAPISSGVQSRPTKTGHPTRAYFSNKFATGCRLALHLGNTRRRNFPDMTPSLPVYSLSNRHWSSTNAVAELFSHQYCRTLSRLSVGCTAAANTLDSRFFSGSLRVESAHPNRVLNLVLVIADGRYDSS